MNRPILGLDHVLIAVPDLEAAAESFEAMGFTLTPKGQHAEWGTANRCAMFGYDYVELIAPEGEGAKADALRAFLAARGGAGLMGVAFAIGDVHRTREALQAAGVAVGPARTLSRAVETPDGQKTAEFGLADLPSEATPGLSAFLCQHRTPDVVRFPSWLAHANSAHAIRSVTGIIDEPERHMLTWDKLFGPGAATPTDDVIAVRAGASLLFFSPPDDLGQLHPETEYEELPDAPALVALTIRVADVERTAALLKKNGVAFSRDQSGRIRIDREDACGVFLEFEAG